MTDLRSHADGRAVSGSPTSVRRAVPWAYAALGLVLVFGLFLRFVDQGPLGIDSWWHGLLSVTRGSAAYAVAIFMAEVGSGVGAAACTGIAAALLFALRMPRDAAAVITATVGGVVVSEIVKALVLRPRPLDQMYFPHGSSYPSGHTMGAAALAISLALVIAGSDALPRTAAKWAWVAAACWILLMMWSRTALHVHWLSDVVAGALLGFAAAILARRFWREPRPERAARRVS
ncbi:MAG: phosphatase PAP2 family protein [Leucobacter sp.]